MMHPLLLLTFGEIKTALRSYRESKGSLRTYDDAQDHHQQSLQLFNVKRSHDDIEDHPHHKKMSNFQLLPPRGLRQWNNFKARFEGSYQCGNNRAFKVKSYGIHPIYANAQDHRQKRSSHDHPAEDHPHHKRSRHVQFLLPPPRYVFSLGFIQCLYLE